MSYSLTNLPLIVCSSQQRLLDPKHFLLPFIGSRFPLEVAVGTNGRVWINSKEVKHTIVIARCIEAVDPDGGGLDESGIKAFFNTLDL
jgi:exosome complex component RRP40